MIALVIANVSNVSTPSEKSLPDDIDALKSMIVKMTEEIVRLEHSVEVFRKLAFGSGSEKKPLPSDASTGEYTEGNLFMAELLEEAQRVAEASQAEGTVELLPSSKPATPKKKGGRRSKFPPHLPVARSTFELPEAQRICECGSSLHEIRKEVRRELERLETAVTHEIERAVYGCRSCGAAPKMAPGPDRVIEKGIMGKSFLAQVIIDRFQNHMPYYRLEKKYASEGLDLSRSVLQRSTARVAELLEPIANQLRSEILKSPAIHTDDTPVTIVENASGKVKKGRTWIYLDLAGRHFYDFTESRNRDGPAKILAGYSGFIHADAYPGYDQLFIPDGATEVACWAHVRRKFVEASTSDPTLAAEGVKLIARLYAVEKAAREEGLDAVGVFELRRKHARAVIDEIAIWLDLTATKVLPKSPLMTAITYARNQWDALKCYLCDGRLGIDNNPAERALRPFAVGRKNWLFFQSDTGGRTASILASLLQTAKAIGIDIRAYFRDVMTRIAHCSDVSKLTPHGWKLHFEAEVAQRKQQAIAAVISSS